ncbi:hypothetical protein FACS189440_17640 [Bacteroidia bacterium]|nr:hypothetical protein FACS189423_00010 [Bacteroidia bacterium]GHT50356.1 hypothetical protein FACS189440_17640 [Bacteroidia bacterium]
MSFKKEFEECIESIRAIEMSFLIAKDLDVLLPTFFENNFARLKKVNEELKRIKNLQPGMDNRQNSIWQATKDKIVSKIQKEEKTFLPETVEMKEDKPFIFSNNIKNLGIKTEIQNYLTLNDRFLIQRDLFNDNAEFMDSIVNQLNTLNTMEETLHYLDSMFAWDWESDSARLFKEIVEKRFV